MKLPLKLSNWPARWRELYEERAGIMEYQGNLSRFTAETRAEQNIRKQAEAEKAVEVHK